MRKVIELKGRKLEPEHLIKNSKEVYGWETPENLPPFKYVYNDAQVKKYKEKEIKSLNGKIKKLNENYREKIRNSKKKKKKFKKRDLKLLSIGRALSIINGPEKLKTEKENKIKELGKKLK